MLYLLLTVLCTLFLLVLFKLFPRYNVNVYYAIIVNYLTAGITGIVFMEDRFNAGAVLASEWLKISLPLGLVFISVFYLISQTAQRISLSTASVANKMSVVIPVLFSILFLKETLTVTRALGILLALLAVYFSTRGGKEKQAETRLFWLPVLVFFGSGLIDLSINASSAFYVKTKTESALFSITTFLSAFCAGAVSVIWLFVKDQAAAMKNLNWRNLAGGIVLGVPNYFSIYFLFRTLDEKLMSSAQLFTLLNLSTVLLSALAGRLIFGEKLTLLNLLGIFTAVAAILLITL